MPRPLPHRLLGDLVSVGIVAFLIGLACGAVLAWLATVMIINREHRMQKSIDALNSGRWIDPL